jgi:hypothetical protein
MKNGKHVLGVVCLIAGLLCAPVWSGELSVGSKVIYPGGADQPPKEKDVGIKLKANVVGGSVATENDELSDVDDSESPDYQGLLDEGNTRLIIDHTAGKTDAESLAFRALALQKVGRKAEALRASQAALENGEDLPWDVRDRLENLQTPVATDSATLDP